MSKRCKVSRLGLKLAWCSGLAFCMPAYVKRRITHDFADLGVPFKLPFGAMYRMVKNKTLCGYKEL